MNSLDKIAPYPSSAEEVTAKTMVQAYAVSTQLNLWLWQNGSGDEAKAAEVAFAVHYGLTYLLRELEERAGTAQADEVARLLWIDLKNPEALGPTLHEWLAEYEIDPTAVNKIAEEFIAEAAQAETGGGS